MGIAAPTHVSVPIAKAAMNHSGCMSLKAFSNSSGLMERDTTKTTMATKITAMRIWAGRFCHHFCDLGVGVVGARVIAGPLRVGLVCQGGGFPQL